MLHTLFPIPQAPAWALDRPTLERRFDFIPALAACPQDAHHHAEGDVWIHTGMVLEALAAMPAWRALPPADQALVFAAAFLHDLGKPDCTRTEDDGRITSRGHSQRGAILARQLLWRAAVPFTLREQIVALIRYHQIPFFLIERPDPRALAAEVSQTARCDLLALVTEADARGRICADLPRLLDNIELFREYCIEEGCFDRPWPFPSDHGRFRYFVGGSGQLDYQPFEDFRCEVVVMSGMPGAGKDSWIRANLPDWPVVSLDRIRKERGVDPAGAQGEVITAAKEKAREYLRKGERFVWNATNISRQMRQLCTKLFADYNAWVRMVYVEVSEETLRVQNRSREAVVPEAVIDRLLDKWEVPDLTEAHRVDYVVQ